MYYLQSLSDASAGYPPWLWPWPSSHVPVVLQLVFSDCLSTGPGPDKEEDKLKLSLHSACVVLCFWVLLAGKRGCYPMLPAYGGLWEV